MNKPKFVYWSKYLTKYIEDEIKLDFAVIVKELGHLDGNYRGNLDSSLTKLDKELAIYNDQREMS